jgi:hypothetical protein
MEEVICDADIAYFTFEEFIDSDERLRKEEGVDRETWYTKNIPQFVSNAKYYTKTARKLCGDLDNYLNRLNMPLWKSVYGGDKFVQG